MGMVKVWPEKLKSIIANIETTIKSHTAEEIEANPLELFKIGSKDFIKNVSNSDLVLNRNKMSQ